MCIHKLRYMEVKGLREYGEMVGKSIDLVRSSTVTLKQDLQLYAEYNGKYYPINKKLSCVIYGEGAPLTKRQQYLNDKPPSEPKKPNKEKAREYRRRYTKNPEIKFKCQTRTMIYNAFTRACRGVYKKNIRTEVILGCTLDEFVLHISSQFTEGMTIQNYGSWHIDHIKPLALAKTHEEIVKLNHHTNLQPLWAIDNRKKRAKYEQ